MTPSIDSTSSRSGGGASGPCNTSALPEELVLHAGPYEARINTVGASLRSLTFKGYPLTDAYELSSDAKAIPFCAGIVLAPWPNRVRDGQYEFGGRAYHLELTEPERNNAIHGLVGTRRWNIEAGADAGRGELWCEVDPSEGWPWTLRVSAVFELAAKAGLTVTYSVTNTGAEDSPLAFGVHTYLNAWGEPLDECVATIPVTHCLPLDSERNLPVEPLSLVPLDQTDSHDGDSDLHGIPVRQGPAERSLARVPENVDLLHGQLMDGVWLDHAFAAAPAASDSRTARLVHPNGRGVELTCSREFDWFQVFTADPAHDAPFPGRGRALAVEPMTAPPDALRSGVGITRLEPQAMSRFSLTMSAIEPL